MELQGNEPKPDRIQSVKHNRICFYNYLDLEHNFSPICRSTRVRIREIEMRGRAGVPIDKLDNAYWEGVREHVNDKHRYQKRDRYIALWMEAEESADIWHKNNDNELTKLIKNLSLSGQKSDWQLYKEDCLAKGMKTFCEGPRATLMPVKKTKKAPPTTAESDELAEDLAEIGMTGDGILPEEVPAKMASMRLEDDQL